MMKSSKQQQRRRGAVVPLVALLLIPLMAMMAFAVDISYIVMVTSDLQNAADSAALAGAEQLQDYYAIWMAGTSSQRTTAISTAETNATTYAQNYAKYNSAGGVNPVLPSSDVTFGYFDGTTYTSPAPSTHYPNTVQVTLRYDGQTTTNPKLSLFFGPVIGTSSVPITVTARATIYTAPINSLSYAGSNLHVLPMAYDQAHWKNFLSTGKDPDGNSTTDSNGLPEIQVYPSVKDTGNFGELSLDDNHTGSNDVKNWITNGMSSSDVSALVTANLIPLSSHPANTWNWSGNTGMQSDTVMKANNYTGDSFVLPLFQAYNSGSASANSVQANASANPNDQGGNGNGNGGGSSSSTYQAGTGNGSNYYYDIVQFVTVKIMPVSDTNKQVVVQPVGMLDASFVYSTSIKAVPAGVAASDGSYPTTFTTPKLTQ
jgi:Flp pilus assembly protein TadG